MTDWTDSREIVRGKGEAPPSGYILYCTYVWLDTSHGETPHLSLSAEYTEGDDVNININDDGRIGLVIENDSRTPGTWRSALTTDNKRLESPTEAAH